MSAYGKMLSEFWGLPFSASSVATEAQKSCAKLAKCQKSKLFFAFPNHIFFRDCLLHFLFIRLDMQLAVARRWERRTVVDVDGKWPENTYVCLSVCLSCRFGQSFNLISSECSKFFRWVPFFCINKAVKIHGFEELNHLWLHSYSIRCWSKYVDSTSSNHKQKLSLYPFWVYFKVSSFK